MLAIYSLLLTAGFIFISPLFILRREKYAAGLSQRLGNYPEFTHDGRKVIWLHCVSVGEANAARPLVDKIREELPDHRLVISTTTKTGQDLAQDIFRDKVDAVFYFPFDWKFSVRKALDNFRPSLVLLMETEIWPRFIHEAKANGAKVAIVNGRLSEKSFRRYSYFRGSLSRIFKDVDLALMQGDRDAARIGKLGIDRGKIEITGNLKFEQPIGESEAELTEAFRERFGIDGVRPLIVAASTHEPEEAIVLKAFLALPADLNARLLVVPRHPERFDSVASELASSGLPIVRRTDAESRIDAHARIILLDSIGELRAVYALADIVFVGGSLIPHGGQSVLEPAATGKAIITGPHTHNFAAIVSEFLEEDALIQLSGTTGLTDAFQTLLADSDRRYELGKNAQGVMLKNTGAVQKTIDLLKPLVLADTYSPG